MRAMFFTSCIALSGCNALVGGVASGVADEEVQPGLASCLASIGRADVAADPGALMSRAEIDALVDCTAERAGGR